MPKGTVVTLPDDTVPAKPNPPGPSFAVSRMTGKAALLFLPLLQRESLPLNIIAFLLSRVSIMGELAPFGLAFFTAVAEVAKGRAPAAAIWMMAGVLSTGRYFEAVLYALAVLLYFRLVDKLDRMQRKLQAAPLFVFAVITLGGMVSVVWQNGTLYQFMQVVFNAAICIVLAYIFMSGVKLLVRSGETQATGEMQICLVIMLAAAVAGLGEWMVAGYSLRNIAGSFMIMALALGGGAGLGASVGVVVGLAAGLTDDYASIIISLYAIAGLLAGVFRMLGKFAVVLGFLLGSIITVLYFSQADQLVRVMTEAAIGAAAFMAVPSSFLALWGSGVNDYRVELAGRPEHIREAAAKLSGIAEMLGGLVATSDKVAGETDAKVRDEETARLLSSIGEQVCGPCLRRINCWDKDFYRTYQAVLDALSLAEQAPMTSGGLPKVLRDGCIRTKELSETVNEVVRYNRTHSLWQKRLAATRRTVTEQIDAIGSIVGNLAQELNKEILPSGESVAACIRERAMLAGCPVFRLKVSGNRGATVVEVDKRPCGGTRECINTIVPLVAAQLKEKLTLDAECGDVNTNRNCRLCLRTAAQFSVQTGVASLAKEQGVSGDTCVVVPLSKGRVALIISDGMGSGSRAAGESAAAVDFLSKLLKAGFEVDIAVKTVNALLLLHMPEESFATVDMVVIDTFAGEAEFLKVGSAPSFVKRVREVATIGSSTLPIGILHQVEIEPVKWLLASGDMIVMVSDGVVEAPYRGKDRNNWIVNFLRRIDGNPQEVADGILRQALDMTGANIRDDMTVLVAKVLERPGLGL